MRLLERIHEDSQGFVRGFAKLGRGFVRLWERIHRDS